MPLCRHTHFCALSEINIRPARRCGAFAAADPRLSSVTFLLPPSRRNLGALALEMERGARQYAVVEEQSLLEIYAERVEEFRRLLAQHALMLPDDPDVQALREQIDTLARLPELPMEAFRERLNEFLPFAQHIEAMRQATGARIDARVDRIRARAKAVQTRLWWQTAALVSASLLLMLLFTRLIIHPIRQLERRILGIGSVGDVPIAVDVSSLAGTRLDPESVRGAVEAALEDLDCVDDLHATASYRRRAAGRLAEQALEQARTAAMGDAA